MNKYIASNPRIRPVETCQILIPVRSTRACIGGVTLPVLESEQSSMSLIAKVDMTRLWWYLTGTFIMTWVIPIVTNHDRIYRPSDTENDRNRDRRRRIPPRSQTSRHRQGQKPPPAHDRSRPLVRKNTPRGGMMVGETCPRCGLDHVCSPRELSVVYPRVAGKWSGPLSAIGDAEYVCAWCRLLIMPDGEWIRLDKGDRSTAHRLSDVSNTSRGEWRDRLAPPDRPYDTDLGFDRYH